MSLICVELFLICIIRILYFEGKNRGEKKRKKKGQKREKKKGRGKKEEEKSKSNIFFTNVKVRLIFNIHRFDEV